MTIVSPMGQLRPVFADKNGKRLSGGKVFTYEPGTLTPKATYTDALNLIPNTNPIDLDKHGEADIFLNGDYRIRVVDRHGTLIDDYDNLMAWATKRYLDSALSGFASGANKFYPTLAGANADIANIAVNQVVNIGELENGGLWSKESNESTVLTKVPYDAFELAKQYSNQKQVVQEQYINDLFAAQTQNVENIINQQGVSLQQLDSYYNYLMQRLAQIAVDKGWEASFVVDESGKTQQAINNQAPTVIQQGNVVGDGVTNESVALQTIARKTDEEFKNHIEFPTLNSDFLVDETVVIQEPTMLIGDAAPTYNRGDGKTGKIIIGNTTHAFDLGNYRTRGAAPYVLDVPNKRTKNPADQWTVKNLAFVPKSGEPALSKTALLHTAKTDGPDRGVLLVEISGTGLEHVFRTEDTGSQTQIANFTAIGVCASNNKIPFKFDGASNGGLVLGCQVEQNTEGAFHGKMNGPWMFFGSMFEGQPNCFNIEVPPITGNRTSKLAWGCYFEGNSGDYVLKIKNSASNGAVDYAYNWIQKITAKSYIYIDESAPLRIYNKDALPVTFFKYSNAQFGSDFFSYGVNHYIQHDISHYNFGSVVFIEKFANFFKTSSDFIKSNVTANPLISTPLGHVRCTTANQFLTIPVAVAANDVVQINIFAYLDFTQATLQVYDSATSVEIAAIDYPTSSNKKWALHTFTIKSSMATPSLRIRMLQNDSTQVRTIAGASAKVLTARSDGDYDIYPELPVLNIESLSKNYSANFSISMPELAAGASWVTTANDANFLTDDLIVASVNGTNTLYFVNAWVGSAGIIYIRFTSTGAIVTARTADVKIKAVRD